ncbi:MAG: flagellin FliC [Propionivibrio sp.]|jgi:flagellin|uniref:flagellin N-terminal helical domain-containing protein n=1 Tax=Propionivibrio sp. TaxID=2212460 RepID=UPI001B427D1F|nr:flagellin [Propionivibrio sp.]MBP7204447.1 flagellin FliC [Propionivibrio sp.]MBP8215517.1 flagellin FliC [Propionivibrio sp.]
MALTINTNVASLNAQRNLNTSQGTLKTSMQRLSSGLRVNSAKDDAAGLGIAEKMTAQSRGMTVAERNANDGISLAQTAEGGMAVMATHLQRMRELATQAASGQYDGTNLSSLNQEFQALQNEVARIAVATTFNGKQVLGNDSTMSFQIGAGITTENQISITTVTGNFSALVSNLAVSTSDGATGAMEAIDTALNTVSDARAGLGALQSRFEGVVTQLQSQNENIQSARGRILDADYAAETANLARSQILQQAGTAMLAQANQLGSNVLTLLQG